MINTEWIYCPNCGGKLKYFGYFLKAVYGGACKNRVLWIKLRSGNCSVFLIVEL